MSKRKSSRNVQRKAKPNKRKPRVNKGKSGPSGPVSYRGMLDRGGVAYAHLLRDPCNAPLVNFYGGASGYVQRFTSILNVGTTAGSTAGALSFMPGNGYTLATFDVVNETTSGTWAYGSANCPGYSFLNNTARGVRVLAACVKFISKAPEQSRTGTMFYGNLGQAEVSQSLTATPAMLETTLPVSIRTPSDQVEVRWGPGDSDADYTYTLGSGSTIGSSGDGIVVGWSDQPAGVGFKVVITAVVEWLPNVTNGFTVNTLAAVPSTSSVAMVKSALYNANPNWWHAAGQITAKALRGAVIGSAVYGGASGALIGGIRALTM